jgi:hypothetical protein
MTVEEEDEATPPKFPRASVDVLVLVPAANEEEEEEGPIEMVDTTATKSADGIGSEMEPGMVS